MIDCVHIITALWALEERVTAVICIGELSSLSEVFQLLQYANSSPVCFDVLSSSDSSDSRLPIIRREEASTDETYDETLLDERDQTMLSMDM